MQGCMKSFLVKTGAYTDRGGGSMNKFFRIVLTSLKIML